MAWRFKASKYKNAAPIVPKPELCVRDICVGSYQTYGNNIAASAAFMAFNWEHAGSSLAILPIDDCGRKSKTMPLLHAHSDTVTDAQFSPFHDGLLATASQDCLVKVWHIPDKGLEQSLDNPEITFSHKQRRVETVGFHPTADCLLYSTAAGCVTFFDLTAQKEVFSSNEHPDIIQSLSWKADGSIFATNCKDKVARIVDPRSRSLFQMSTDSHQSIKDSRAVWLGDQNRILTTGFDAARVRQVIIRDLRMFNQPEKLLELDCSTGILMPLYDPDTNMLFLAGKGDTTINYMEVTDKEPFLTEGLRHTGEQTKGACLVPKRALKVMEGEVNRVLQLTSNMVIPIMYQVPRKSYRDFHSDLYPDTNHYKTELSAGQWISGVNTQLPKMSLDPSKRELGDAPIIIHRGNLIQLIKNIENKKICQKQVQNGAKHNMSLNEGIYSRKIAGQDDLAYKQIHESPSETVHLRKMEIITSFENKYKTDSEKEYYSCSSIPNPKKTIRDDSDGSPENDSNGSSGSGSWNQYKSVTTVNTVVTPPKPLPRTSRNNSMSETGSLPQHQYHIENDVLLARPVARPRITTTTYKPRLGPKPFASNTSDITFDKVFSVPQVPGSNTADYPDNCGVTTPENPGLVEIQIKKDTKVRRPEEHLEDKNGSHPHGIERTLSTSERRKLAEEESSEKLFENHSESSGNSTESEDKPDDLKRLSSNRCSIAERRRLYEARSKSMQDEKPHSPVPIMRREQSRTDCESLNRQSVPEGKVPEPRSPQIKKDSTFSKRTSTVFGKVSKFRHLKGTPGHKSTQIDNLRNLSRQIPGECNGFHANHERVAVPLSGPGGKIAIFELKKPGRLPDGVIPSLVNGANIMDFQWNPFNTHSLAVACDDGIVRFWKIPKDGLTEPTNETEAELNAHFDKIYFIRFHPIADNVLLTASYDMNIKLWDLKIMEEKLIMKGHTDQIFDFAWSPCGNYGATVCKDGKLRVYNPRQSELPIKEGNGPVGTRGARLSFALDGQYLVVTGFDKVSERQISLYSTHDLSAPLNTVGLDVSPAILMPFYDEDSSTLFVTGRGDSTIYCYEITDEEPYVCPLSHHKCSTLHQGLSFLSKNHCDIASVEFSKAYRLTNTTIEPLSFTVPRIKSELFQDDLFPPTRITWVPTMSSNEWFAKKDKRVKRISLQPDGMEALSSIQPPTSTTNVTSKKIDNVVSHSHISEFDKSRLQKIQKSVSARMEYNSKLEQDDMEGVDDFEWEE